MENGDGNPKKLRSNSVDYPIKLPEIVELEDPMKELLAKLLPHVKANEYSALIGDDTSARIPARILWQVINAIREEQGEKRLPLFFIRSLRKIEDIPIAPIIDLVNSTEKAINSYPGTKALIITEYMRFGAHVNNIGQILTENKIHFDVASVFSGKHKRTYLNLADPDANVFIGKKSNTPMIYSAPAIAGVKTDYANNQVIRGDDKERDITIQARREADTLALRLFTFAKTL